MDLTSLATRTNVLVVLERRMPPWVEHLKISTRRALSMMSPDVIGRFIFLLNETISLMLHVVVLAELQCAIAQYQAVASM